MLYASVSDVFIIFVIYLFLALVYREFYWNKKKRIFWFLLLTIMYSILLEVRALLTGRWVYAEIMPTIFGIGVSPLVQLAITGLVSLMISEKFVA